MYIYIIKSHKVLMCNRARGDVDSLAILFKVHYATSMHI